jgi:hypothetical protein
MTLPYDVQKGMHDADMKKLDARITAQHQRLRASEAKFSTWLRLVKRKEDQLAMSILLLDAMLDDFDRAMWKRSDVLDKIKGDLMQLRRAREAATRCLASIPSATQREGEALLDQIRTQKRVLQSHLDVKERLGKFTYRSEE